LTLSALFRLRAMMGKNLSSYRIPFYPALPAVLVVGALSIVASSLFHRPVEALYGAATVMAGIPVYLYWRQRGARFKVNGVRL